MANIYHRFLLQAVKWCWKLLTECETVSHICISFMESDWHPSAPLDALSLSDSFPVNLNQCVIWKKQHCAIFPSWTGSFGKALMKTRFVWKSMSRSRILPHPVSHAKWTSFPLLVPFPISSVTKTTDNSVARAGKISVLSWVWNGAAPVIHHTGLFTIPLFSHWLTVMFIRPMLKFLIPHFIALCCTKNAECFSFRSFFVSYLCFYSTFLCPNPPLKDLLMKTF